MKKYRNNASPCIILRIPSEIFMRAKCRRINIVRAMLLLDKAKWNPENLWATMQIIRKICTSIGPQNYDGYRSKSMKLYPRMNDICFTCIGNDRCNWKWRGEQENPND